MAAVLLEFTFLLGLGPLVLATVSDNFVMPLPEIFQIESNGSCPNGYFQCNGSLECIVQNLNCNNEINCDDGSDEWNCDDDFDTKYTDHLYRKNPGADNPNETCYWSNLNTTCYCRANDLLCTLKELTEIPFNLPEYNITILDLTGNIYPVINKTFFKDLPQVKTLVLKHCLIEEIHPHAFQRLSSIYLDTLHLSQNKITTLPKNFFPPQNSLKVLILSGNKITELHSYDFQNLNHLEELDLRNNELTTFHGDVFEPLQSLELLYLNGNKIQAINQGMIPKLGSLMTLSLSHNHITNIKKDSFDLPVLRDLYLSGNQLYEIQNGTFCGLPKLLGLNLDDNLIDSIELEAFACIDNINSLELKGNKFQSLDKRVLMNLYKLDHIVWVMASVGIIGNILVLVGRFLKRSRRRVEHSLYLRHLAASDLLMGIYLAAIASADILFRGEYIKHEEAWCQSIVCATCGFLSTLSCQSSTLLLTLVTYDRLVSVTRPLQPSSNGKYKVIFRLMALWGASIATAAAPLSSIKYFGNHFYGNNGVCLSLHIHDPYAKGWEYSAGIFIFINTFALIFIGISYLRMLQAIRGSGEAMRSTLSGRENIVARRFAVIVATDCACWLPIILVKIAALAGVRISPALYAWLAVLVLPVNSALNPILYTLTTTSFKQQISKYLPILLCGNSIESRTHTGYESALSVSLGHITSNSGRKRLLQKRISYV